MPPTANPSRDLHLFAPGAKRILSLDGGGVRGLLTLGILEHIEKHIENLEGRPVCLGEWFDLIGGTSTGSIIATGLALGLRVADLRELYLELAPKIFRKSWRRIIGLQPKFDERALMEQLLHLCGRRQLDSADLKTGLCILLKRLDTGSSWLLMNNPHAVYWNDAPDGSFSGNGTLRLADIVRASTAAPGYFRPELITFAPGQPAGVFVDGGLTLHNNPALALTMAALIPGYGLQWQAGSDKMLVVSVGTGAFRQTLSVKEAIGETAAVLAFKSLLAMISESQNLVLTLMTYFGESPVSWPINSEIGDLGAIKLERAPLFRFLRYDARLETDWLQRELDVSLSPQDIATLQRMDDADNVTRLLELGRATGARQIQEAHWQGFRRQD